jgi:hypothetical protein
VPGGVAEEFVTGSGMEDGAWASKPAVTNTIEWRLPILGASFLFVIGANREYSHFDTLPRIFRDGESCRLQPAIQAMYGGLDGLSGQRTAARLKRGAAVLLTMQNQFALAS